MIIGIDPGQRGGVAVLTEQGAVVFAYAMPIIETFIDEMRNTLSSDPFTFVFIEKAQSMPGNKAASMFNYGTHFGEMLGVLKTLQIPHELVHPRTWSKELHAGTKAQDTKLRSIEAARRLFPSEKTVRDNRPHDGIVEAILIAEYGRRKRQGHIRAVG